jgi:hypothetical protein
MSFLAPALAFGALAAVIPLVIHLLNRSRYRVVKWGAMHLLDSVVRINRRRVRLEQLILLAIRTAIPVAIALFMARPVLTDWKVLPGDVPRSVVVALDNSYSMEAGGADRAAFSRAKQEVIRLLNGLQKGSDVVLRTLAGDEPATSGKPTFRHEALLGRIQELEGGYGMADPPAAIEAGLDAFTEMSHADRELVLISDFQKVSWGPEQASGLARCASLREDLPVKPHVTLYRMSHEQEQNLCVESLELSKLIVGVRQKVQVRATVRNHGERPHAGLRIHFRVDGEERETSEIVVGPEERSQVVFSTSFDAPGSHYVEVRVDADPLTADNGFLAAIPVWDRIPVVLVSGEGRGEPLTGEVDFLEVALQPFTAGGVELSDLLEPRVVEAESFDGGDLEEARVVVLANVEKLRTDGLDSLRDFVRTGGGILIFPGSRCDIGWYNTMLHEGTTDGTPDVEAGRLLPLPFRGLAGSLTDRSQQTSIVGEHFEHECLTLFNLPENGSITGGEVRMWYRFDEATRIGSGAAGSAGVLARLATGDPFLVEGHYGEGRALLCSTACDADWGNLPMRPFYLPLMQQLVTYLASTVYPPRNVEVGDELAVLLPRSLAGARLTVTLPGGDLRKVEAIDRGKRAVGTFTDTRLPGLYLVEGPGVKPVHFVVNTSREESALEQLSDEEMDGLAEMLRADVVRSGSEYEELQSRRHHGREIWRQLFWFALLLLFAELVVQRLFSRRRP